MLNALSLIENKILINDLDKKKGMSMSHLVCNVKLTPKFQRRKKS